MIGEIVHVLLEGAAWLVPDWLAAWWRPWVWIPFGLVLVIAGFFAWPERVPSILAWALGGLAVLYGVLAEVKQLESR